MIPESDQISQEIKDMGFARLNWAITAASEGKEKYKRK